MKIKRAEQNSIESGRAPRGTLALVKARLSRMELDGARRRAAEIKVALLHSADVGRPWWTSKKLSGIQQSLVKVGGGLRSPQSSVDLGKTPKSTMELGELNKAQRNFAELG